VDGTQSSEGPEAEHGAAVDVALGHLAPAPAVVAAVAVIPEHEVVALADLHRREALPVLDAPRQVLLRCGAAVEVEGPVAYLEDVAGEPHHPLDERDRRVARVPEDHDIPALDGLKAVDELVDEDPLPVPQKRLHARALHAERLGDESDEEEAEEARRLGLDLIITDHHTPGLELPDAVAIINTKQDGDEYPEKQLAGVGTAFRLAHALEKKLHPGDDLSSRFLDLVALGTVADMVPLIGENRWMVREGLNQIRQPKRQGLFSLISISGLKAANVRAGDIGYMLGPRLNAAGRLETAKRALLLLMTDSVFEAGKLAQDLDNQNRERQDLTVTMTESAEEIITTAGGDPLLLFALNPEYNPGVVGLVASRLTEKFYRPAIVGQCGEQTTRASCRSIPEFHITQALESCGELFENFGGHAAAAGFTVLNDRLPEVMERLNTYAQEKLGGLALRPTLVADAEIELSELKPDILNQIDLIEPTGYGNPQVSLVSRGLQVRDTRAVGQEGRHLKLVVTDGWITYDAIAFRHGHWAQAMPKTVDLLYRFEANEFNGRKSLQLNVRDLKPSA